MLQLKIFLTNNKNKPLCNQSRLHRDFLFISNAIPVEIRLAICGICILKERLCHVSVEARSVNGLTLCNLTIIRVHHVHDSPEIVRVTVDIALFGNVLCLF